MIDTYEDLQQKKDWESNDSPEFCLMSDLIDYAIHGLQRCEDYCGSETYCGEDACFCIRARLPHPKHYELYEEMRLIGKELSMLKILGNLSQEQIPEGILKKGEKINEKIII